ncbi:dynamin-1-like protein [Folsomia candida]|uniref:dynamin-1-like protein n=1 Tax=Folsomia candida TaxID=158441 RepID=UPI000B90766F|nr:dynamin-1-like protein [Folsomia candida]
MEDLIPLINKLQSVFKTTGMEEIKLPQIVVVGAQSSGKSSVLESLVKKSFLPRGTGIVTRCPIILQLNQIKEASKKGKHDSKGPDEWCRFSKTPEKTYTDFDEVRHAIEDLQVEMAGDKKGISMEPIILEVFFPNVIDLTVVNLPGIVKIALDGQPWDIEEQVHNLITNYINNESAIILAVSAANADIATSESIKIANKVDPNGNRTIAVVTKLDLMDKGTDAANVLTGEIIKVKLGIIGVINRSQQDINNNTSMEEALRKEEEILRKTYPQIHGIGSPYLAKRLNQILTDHIHQNLPALIRRIAQLSEKCESDLHCLGREISTDAKDCSWLIMETTLQFVKNFREIVHFRPIDVLDDEADLFAVSVNGSFKKLREEIVTDEKSIDTLQIMKALKNTQNFEGFASIEQVFKTIVKKQIMLMASPAIHCAQEVHDLLSLTANKCFEDPRLKYLNRMIKGVVDDLLDDQLKHTITGINEYIKLQTGMIFSSDEVFVRLLTEVLTQRKMNWKSLLMA